MIKINTQFQGNLFNGKLFEIYQQECHYAMTESVLRLESEIKQNTPVHFGFLRNGIIGKVISAFRGEVGVQGPAQIYAPVIEFGRNPGGKFPPPDAIQRWLELSDRGKRFVKEIQLAYGIKNIKTALKSATYLKSKGIARRGTKGVFMFRNARKLLEPTIRRRFEEAVRRAEARL